MMRCQRQLINNKIILTVSLHLVKFLTLNDFDTSEIFSLFLAACFFCSFLYVFEKENSENYERKKQSPRHFFDHIEEEKYVSRS
jgi:hypothetical protein